MFRRALNRFLEVTLHKKPLKRELIGIIDDLVRIYSPSGQELPVVEYSKNLLLKSGFEVVVDEFKNVIASRGKYAPEDKLVCINAHTDTVQKKGDEGVQFLVFYDWVRDAFHSNNRAMIGGDDKCGIAVALTLAAYTDLPMKIVLTSGEEVGSIGAESMDRKHFDDVEFTFTVDRMHGGDLISEYCGLTLAPDTFVKRFIAMSESIGVNYKDTSGSIADAYVFAQYAPAVNLSSGYYNPHSNSDYILVKETYNTMLAIKNAIENKNDLVYAILQAPTDWQKNVYTEIPSMGFGRYGDFGHYGGGARSRSKGRYYELSRKERRKCKIKYGKTRGFDDKESAKRKLPNPDPDSVASIDELIEAYANGEIYDDEWDEMLANGTLTRAEHSIGIDEKIARERYAKAFDKDQGGYDLEEDEIDFKQALDDASTMPIELGDGEYTGTELRDKYGISSGYLFGTVEDDIFVEYVSGQLTLQELSEYLREGSIDRFFFDKCSRDRQTFKQKFITEETGFIPPKSRHTKLASLGFISGYPQNSTENNIFLQFMAGDMTEKELLVEAGEDFWIGQTTAMAFIKMKRYYVDNYLATEKKKKIIPRSDLLRSKLASLAFRSGYSQDSTEDNIFLQFMAGEMTEAELLEDSSAIFWITPNVAAAFIKMKHNYMRGIEIDNHLKSVKKKIIPRGSLIRDELASRGFVSGYKKGSGEDDIFVDFMSGDIVEFELWEHVRDGMFPDTIREFIKIKQAYKEDLDEIADFERFEKERAFLYNKQHGVTLINESKKRSRDGEKTRVSNMRRDERDAYDEYDDSTGCGN
jgi:hypothetical protein